MRWALLLLCLALPGGDEYTVGVRKLDVRPKGDGWSLRLRLQTDLPRKALVSVQPRLLRHLYNWEKKTFQLTTMEIGGSVGVRGDEPVGRDGRVEYKAIPVPTPGFYDLHCWFDPLRQSESIKKQMGQDFYRHDFPPFSLVVGEVEKIVEELREDFRSCYGMIEDARELLQRIRNEHKEKDWDSRKKDILAKIRKLKKKAEEKSEKSLQNAAFKVLTGVLMEMELAVQAIHKIPEVEPSGGGGGGGQDPHKQGGGDPAIDEMLDGRKFSMEGLEKHLNLANRIRMREYFSWLVHIERNLFTEVTGSYEAAKGGSREDREDFPKLRTTTRKQSNRLEDAFEHAANSSANGEEFGEITRIDEERPFADFFGRFERFVVTLKGDVERPGEVPEAIAAERDELKIFLEDARRKALGKKKD